MIEKGRLILEEGRFMLEGEGHDEGGEDHARRGRFMLCARGSCWRRVQFIFES